MDRKRRIHVGLDGRQINAFDLGARLEVVHLHRWTGVPEPLGTPLLPVVSRARLVLLCRRRTHLEAPFAGAATNVQDAFGALERGKPVALLKECANNHMLHV
jgi:hypothetical protein